MEKKTEKEKFWDKVGYVLLCIGFAAYVVISSVTGGGRLCEEGMHYDHYNGCVD